MLNFENSPIIPVIDDQDNPLKIPIKINSNTIYVRLWKINVGNANIYLIDTNVEENTPWDRELSASKTVLDKLLEVKGHEFLANSMGEVITGCLLESGLSMSDIMKNLEICISATILNQELV
ncbi:hypothetical protein LCGC14_2157990 [marine sediment metagenome]|uniref:Uncharacterized protein n=1 Tax=marine sediment metagenome TaxID=412755 RepID=A0A0F9EFT3_9ZZZZ